MKRNSVLLTVCIAFFLILISACKKSNQASDTHLEVKLTDGITTEYSAINVDLQGLDYNTSESPGVTTGWTSIGPQQPGVINLLTLRNGQSSVLSNLVVPPVNIKQFRLRFGNNNTIVKNGITYPLVIPDQIKTNGAAVVAIFNLTGGSRSIWIDFEASRSVIYNPSNNTYTLSPELRSFDVNESGTIEGNVLPASGEPFLAVGPDSSAVNPPNINIITYPEKSANGYFKIMGIPPGLYQVYMATSTGILHSKTVTKITVKKNEVSSIGTHSLQ